MKTSTLDLELLTSSFQHEQHSYKVSRHVCNPHGLLDKSTRSSVYIANNGVHLSHSRQVAHVYYQSFDFKSAEARIWYTTPECIDKRSKNLFDWKVHITLKTQAYDLCSLLFNIIVFVECPSCPDHRGLLRFLFFFRVLLKTTREESKMSNFHTTLFKIVLYWCLDLIRHNIGTKLKLNCHVTYFLIFLFRKFCLFPWSDLLFT